MRTKTLSYWLSLFLVLFSFCAGAASQSETQKQDGQIIEIFNVINSGEIVLAKEALKRTTNPDIKGFANKMITDHSNGLAEFKKLSQKINISPLASEKSKSIQENGRKTLKKLESVPANEFDITYIDAMVKGHEKVLKAIDNKLLPKAANAELKTQLKVTREMVAHHLAMAKAIQTKLATLK